MVAIRRDSAFKRLNSLTYQSMEAAFLFCKRRGNQHVELAHWLHQILQIPHSDLLCIVRRLELDPSRLDTELTRTLDGLERGSTAMPNYSSHLEDAVERGWVYASLAFNKDKVRSGHVLVALLDTADLRSALRGAANSFGKLSAEVVVNRFEELTTGSSETTIGGEPSRAAATTAADGVVSAALGKEEALSRFAVDLTARARKGELDPVLGRDEEIRQVIDILMRRRQNNPLLAGEAGVGKTAVVEGFALRIAKGDVPPALQNVSVRALDLGLLQAGAGVKGEFENRLRLVIEEVQASPQPIILFIDEAHMLIGAGGPAGQGDAANLLKPALARGTLRTIAATTWAEYKKYIEKDPALTRRFQALKVEEPSEGVAVQMIRGLAGTLEKHHQVLILDEALEAAARLSHRYIPARQLPDKAVSLIDTACARVAVSQHGTPAALEDCRRRIELLDTEVSIVEREHGFGRTNDTRRQALDAGLAEEKQRLTALEARFQQETAAVTEIRSLREQITGNGKTAPSLEEQQPLLVGLRQAESALLALQGEQPLIHPQVDAQVVASVVSDWTGVPVGRMVKDEIKTVLNLPAALRQRVVGQDHALDAIARRIQTARAGLYDPNKPIGVFLLVGPSGVGKTETALALAETLYGGEGNLITINMSEFQEAHTVSTLKGSPPGYVGYGEGGVLTEAVRRRPYSVVLLDEIEKAHPDVHEILFQVFDKGAMEDSEGRRINFRNTVILLTSNVGTDAIAQACHNLDSPPSVEEVTALVRPHLLQVFPPALLGRLTVIPYYPLADDVLRSIIKLQLGRIQKRVRETHQVEFVYTPAVMELIAARCTELESGGRMIDGILTHTLLPEISREFLSRLMEGSEIKAVKVLVGSDGSFVYQINDEPLPATQTPDAPELELGRMDPEAPTSGESTGRDSTTDLADASAPARKRSDPEGGVALHPVLVPPEQNS